MPQTQSQDTGGIDLASLVSAANNQRASTQQTIDRVSDSLQEISHIGDEAVEAVVNAGKSDAIVKDAEELGKLRAQQASRSAATTLGTNLDSTGELISTLGMRMREESDAADRAREEYYNRKGANFLDNPLDWISNNVFGGTDEAANEYNRHASRYNAASERFDDITSKTTAFAQSQNAIAETRTAASVEAAANSVAQKATAEAARIKQTNLVYNIQGLKTIQELNASQVDQLFKLNSAVMEEQRLTIAKATLEEQRKVHEIAIAERQERLDQKKATQADLDDTANTVNTGRSSLGLQPLPTTQVIKLMQMKGDVGDSIRHQFTIGATAATFGKPVISTSPGESAKIIGMSGAIAPLQKTPSKPVVDLLNSAFSFIRGGGNKTIDLKDPEQVTKATNDVITPKVTAMHSDIKFGDQSNIYAPPDLDSIVSNKAVSDSPLYQKVLKPAIDNGLKEMNPDLILTTAATAVKNKQISYQEAVTGLETLFKTSVLTNNATKDYMRFGIPKQTQYNTEITDPSTLWTQKVDLTDPTTVSNIVSKKLRGYVFGMGRIGS